MASKSFKSNTGAGVSVYVSGQPGPVRIEADETFTTDDKTVIEALQGSPEVQEVKASEGKSDDKDDKDDK